MYGYGARLKAARTNKGLSQSDICDVLGWPREHHYKVSRLESENIAIGAEEFERLVRTLGIDRLELIRLMGYDLHLAPPDALYGPLVEYLSRYTREQQKDLLRLLRGFPTGAEQQ